MIKRFFRDETGLELSEYAVAAALVVAGVVVAFTVLGNAIQPVFKLSQAPSPVSTTGFHR